MPSSTGGVRLFETVPLGLGPVGTGSVGCGYPVIAAPSALKSRAPAALYPTTVQWSGKTFVCGARVQDSARDPTVTGGPSGGGSGLRTLAIQAARRGPNRWASRFQAPSWAVPALNWDQNASPQPDSAWVRSRSWVSMCTSSG